MRKYLPLLLLLFCPAYAHAQGTQVVSGPTDPATCNPAIGQFFYNTTSSTMKTCSATNTWSAQAGGLSNVTSLPATCTPGVTAPVNLTTAPFGVYVCGPTANLWTVDPTFFGKYYGLAPQNFGAKGDTHVYFNCGMSTNNHVTCATGHFQSTDVGKWIESCASLCSSAGAVVNQGTITAFNSATDVTTSMTSGTTYSNTRTAFGTDDDAAMQAWATAMVGTPTFGVPPQVRGGYLPQGGYAIKQPLNIFYPSSCGTLGAATCGEGAPAQGGGGTLQPGIWLTGASTTASYIYVRTAGVFTWPTTTSNTAALNINGWSFGSIGNFAVIGDQSAHNTTTVTTAIIAGMLFDNSQHVFMQSMWIQGFHNTVSGMCGLSTFSGDFESSYTYSASEASDFNGCFGNGGSGAPVSQTMEKVHFDSINFENPTAGINIIIGTSTSGPTINLRQISFNNCTSWNATTPVRMIAVTTPGQEVVQFSDWRQNWTFTSAVADTGFRIDTGLTVNVDFHGSYFEDNTSNAGSLLISNLSANAVVSLYGGSINCATCTNLFSNTGNIFVYGTKLTGPSVANIQTGVGFTYGYFPVNGATGGWTGKGTGQYTNILSTQGVACTNGEIALSAGWQSTGAATVTAVNGTGQTCSWTITTGTTTAANPTVTDTLTNALPVATVACELNIHGGTHVAIAGEGFQQTTLSATAPIFTADFTPTAAGATYFVTRRCGP